MDNVQLADLLFKVIIGFAIPYAVKSLSEIRKSMEGLNTKIAVLIEKDINKDKEIEEVKALVGKLLASRTETEKQILALKLKLEQKND